MWMVAQAALTALVGFPADPGDAPPERYVYAQRQMGVTFRIVLYAGSEKAANAAAEKAFGRIAELNRVMSDYLPTSELERLSATAGTGKAVKVSDDLWRVLQRAQRLSQRTEGAFDVTVGPVVRLWRRARRQKKLPPEEELDAALSAVGCEHLKLDADRQTATLLREGMRLDLGGIAKGDAAQEALKVLQREGITSVLVDGSGDLAIGGPPPGTLGWQIGVAPLDAKDPRPSKLLLLRDVAVATSGDAFQHIVVDGVRYSHIVDPRTGIGLTDRSTVTVIAPTGGQADSLASAVSVLGPKAGSELVEGIEGAAAYIVRSVDDGVETHVSESFSQYELSVERLGEVLLDPEEHAKEARAAAARTLGNIRLPRLQREAMDVLTKTEQKDPCAEVRRAAADALARLREGNEEG